MFVIFFILFCYWNASVEWGKWEMKGNNLLFQTHITRWFALSPLLPANPLVPIRWTDFLARVESWVVLLSMCMKRMRQRRILFLLHYDLWRWLDRSNSAVHCFNASQMSHSSSGILHLNFCFALIHEKIKPTQNERRTELWIKIMMHMCDVLAWKSVGISRINHSLSGVGVEELGIVFIKWWNFKDERGKIATRNIFHINFNSSKLWKQHSYRLWYVSRCMRYMCSLI